MFAPATQSLRGGGRRSPSSASFSNGLTANSNARAAARRSAAVRDASPAAAASARRRFLSRVVAPPIRRVYDGREALSAAAVASPALPVVTADRPWRPPPTTALARSRSSARNAAPVATSIHGATRVSSVVARRPKHRKRPRFIATSARRRGAIPDCGRVARRRVEKRADDAGRRRILAHRRHHRGHRRERARAERFVRVRVALACLALFFSAFVGEGGECV